MTASRLACRVVLFTFGLQTTVLAQAPPPPPPTRSPAPLDRGYEEAAPALARHWLGDVDLRSWSREGAALDGSWEVEPDGEAVTQTAHAGPTFFVSHEDHLNARLRVRVRPGSEDTGHGFLGFVLGYQAPIEDRGHDASQAQFLLLDWKKDEEARDGLTAPEGWTLSRVSGLVTDPATSLWAHAPLPLVEVLAARHGKRTGWTHERDYQVEIRYRTSRIHVAVDGVDVLDVPGSFSAGRVGFYSDAQARVRFDSVSLEAENGTPHANGGSDRTVEAGRGCAASLTLDASASTDPDGDALSFVWKGPFGTAVGVRPTVHVPAGAHTITLTATDGAGASDTTTIDVVVIDHEAPALSCDVPATVRLTAAQRQAGGFTLSPPAARDNCGVNSVERSDPAAFDLGPNTVRWTATDEAGWTGSCDQTVHVVSATAPFVAATVATSQLWPPNHAMTDVGLSVVASSPSGIRPAVTLQVWSDEPNDAEGDGNKSPDTQSDGKRLSLRSERSGNGDGRVYLLRATATNALGETVSSCTTVTVPHSQCKDALASVAAQAAAALAACTATGAPPAGFFALLQGPFAASDPSLPVTPILECVASDASGGSTAVFGYKNENPVPVFVSLGTDNQFTPAPIDRGQPTFFTPGRSPAGQGAFTVPFDGHSLVWKLRTRTAAGSGCAKRCSAPPATPVARDDTASVRSGSSVVIPVLANDSDPQGDPLVVIRVGTPSHGAAVLNANGTVSYTAQAGYVGVDSFDYTISDGRYGTARAIVTVTVTAPPVNKPPTVDAGPDQTTTLPAATVSLSGTVTDDGLPVGAGLVIGWSVVSGPGSVVFSSSSSAVTQATFATAGTYVLRLSASDTQLEGHDDVTVTVNAPSVPTLSIADASALEGSSGTTTARLPATLSSPADHDVTVLYKTVEGTATEGCDYLPTSGSLTIPAGSTSAEIDVSVVGDLDVEPDETLQVVLGDPVGAVLGRAAATLVILNDDVPDQPPAPITAMTPAPGAVEQPLDTKLGWTSADPDVGDALAYDVFFGTAVSPSGQRWQKACTPGGPPAGVAASAFDPDRDRLLVLGKGAEALVLGNATGLGGPPAWTTLSPGSLSPSPRESAAAAWDPAQGAFVLHGGCTDSCGTALADTWLLSNATGDGSPAWSALPAAPLPRSGHIAGFDPATSRLIVFGGTTGAADLNDVVVLKNATGGGTPAWAALTPSSTPPAPRRDAAGVYDPVSNRLFVFGGRAGADDVLGDLWVLLHANGLGGTPEWQLLSPAGESPVPRAGARAAWDAGTGRLLLYGGTTAGRADNTNFILDDAWVLSGLEDGAPTWVRVPPSAYDPLGRFDAVLAYSPFANRLVVAGGVNDKLGPGDFSDLWVLQDAVGTLPLVSSAQPAPLYDPGLLAEGSRYFWRVVARDPKGAARGSSFASFTAGSPALSISDVALPEGDSGNCAFVFPVHLSRASASEVSVAFATADGTATAGEDYIAASGRLVFAPGETDKTLSVLVYGDTVVEPDDTFFVDLAAPVVAHLARARATGTIRNDDRANAAPVVDAGPAVTSTSLTVALQGRVTDDGLPVGADVASQWTLVSGPFPVAFANPSAPQTTATLGGLGTYVLRLSASDTLLTSSADVMLTIVPLPNLVAGPVDDKALVVDGQTLHVGGQLSVPASNPSPTAVSQPFTVTFFEDRNGDAAYEPGTDALLGQTVVPGVPPGGTVTAQASASGELLFRGDAVWAFVDSGLEIPESDETDNVSSSRPCLPPGPVSFAPAVKWFYKTNVGRQVGVMSASMVADLDGDGVPEVVFVDDSAGQLYAIHGRDGSPAFVLSDPARAVASITQVAIGRLGADPLPQIVALGGGVNVNRLMVFEHDGTLRWTAPLVGGAIGYGSGAPILADLDGDGWPEIIVGSVVYDRTGALRWAGAYGHGLNGTEGPVSVVADLDLDGSPEVVAGSTAYHADGSLYWFNQTIPDGYDAIGHFDADPFPEIVHVAQGKIWLLTHDGKVKWGPVSFPDGTSKAGPPAIADVDGDGVPEILVGGKSRLLALRADGTILWPAVTQDISSEGTGVTAFDFDGDGAAEVVYTDEQKLRIYRGRDGFVLFETEVGEGTRLEYGTIADVDGDGHADIVVSANTDPDRRGVLVYSSPDWLGARKVWNEYSYHVTNVNDDLSIPAHETPSWTNVRNGYRQQAIQARTVGCVTALPDLVPSRVTLQEEAGEHVLTARIGNGGKAAALVPVPVSFYDGDPAAGGVRIGMVETGAPMLPGHFEDVTLRLPASLRTESTVIVAANDLGESRRRITESDLTNNVYDSGLALVAGPELPDLTVASIDTSVLVNDSRSLAVTGTLSAVVRNQGDGDARAAFSVSFFEDLDGDGTPSAGDNVLGEARLSGLAADGSTEVSVPVSGTLRFRDAPITVFVDSRMEVVESEERNNVLRSGAACAARPPSEPYVPEVKWSWTGSSVSPTADQVSGVPVVVDLDGDGVPEVVFTSLVGGSSGPLAWQSTGTLRAVRGTDGTEVLSVASPPVLAGTALAAGDIDGDGRPEILALAPYGSGNRLTAFDSTGKVKWQSGALESAGTGGAALGDLDGDGIPEIVVGRQVLDSRGQLRWTGTGGSGGGTGSSVIVDLDQDGVPEVVVGNTAYRANGSIDWQNTAVADGYVAVGSFDGDAFPEVVVVGNGNIWLLDHTGAILWGPLPIPGGGLLAGPPAVADFDGDGRVEIAVGSSVGTSHIVSVFDGRGFLRWKQSRSGQWSIGGRLTASAFDFDGDGAAEVVYADSQSVRILRGADGVVLYESALPRPATASYPVVADVDGDGKAEVVVAAGGPTGQPHGLFALADAADHWVGARRIWNQYAYHITNVGDDGRVPSPELYDPLNFNSFRRSGLRTGFPTASPDLTVSYARRTTSPTGLAITVRVGNAGAAPASAGVAVSFWDGIPGGTLLGRVSTTTSLQPGGFEDVTLTLPGDASSTSTVNVKVDDPGTPTGAVLECQASNNVLDTGLRLNQAPVVNAGPDQTISLPTTVASLAGTVTDDGLPAGSPVASAWSLVSGPGPVVFADPGQPSTTATFAGAGSYTLRLTATDTRLTAHDDVVVTVTPPNQPPVVSAGPSLQTTLPANTVTLMGSATDDGLPVGSTLSTTWSLVQGPAPVQLTNPLSPVTLAVFSAPGTYVLRLTASDTAYTVSADAVATVIPENTPPVVSAGPDQTLPFSTAPMALLGSVTDDGLPVGGVLRSAWILASGPAPVVFQNPASPQTTVAFDVPGVYVLRFTATDGALSSFADMTATVQAATPVGDPPKVVITSPTDGSAITQPTDITGSVSSQNLVDWKLQVRPSGETAFTTIATGTAPVDGVITRFDPTLLLNGLYDVVFRATDTAGRTTSTAMTAVVKDNQKVGQFTVSFVDLEVPVAGSPLRLTRTYDSRDKGQGDFGYGWRVDLANARVQESGEAGLLWYGDKQPGFLLGYCLSATRPAIVSVTTPDGKVYEFEPVLTP
ncbi:MAG TPA: FG-GAP-like repeat-containing protein, partial [Vicinamibacteria bacterium]|nr:FG-GAP-like repeat-containing protein [Vicinamibacteria bacterium]